MRSQPVAASNIADGSLKSPSTRSIWSSSCLGRSESKPISALEL